MSDQETDSQDDIHFEEFNRAFERLCSPLVRNDLEYPQLLELHKDDLETVTAFLLGQAFRFFETGLQSQGIEFLPTTIRKFTVVINKYADPQSPHYSLELSVVLQYAFVGLVTALLAQHEMFQDKEDSEAPEQHLANE